MIKKKTLDQKVKDLQKQIDSLTTMLYCTKNNVSSYAAGIRNFLYGIYQEKLGEVESRIKVNVEKACSDKIQLNKLWTDMCNHFAF